MDGVRFWEYMYIKTNVVVLIELDRAYIYEHTHTVKRVSKWSSFLGGRGDIFFIKWIHNFLVKNLFLCFFFFFFFAPLNFQSHLILIFITYVRNMPVRLIKGCWVTMSVLYFSWVFQHSPPPPPCQLKPPRDDHFPVYHPCYNANS